MKKIIMISLFILSLSVYGIYPAYSSMSPQDRLKQAENWVKTEKGQPWAYKALGYALFELKNYKEARVAFSRAETFSNKPDTEAINGQAYCLYAMGKKDKALELLKKSASIDPYKGKYNDIAHIQFPMKKNDEALISFEKGIKYLKSDEKADAYNGKGYIYYSEKIYKKALESFETAARIAPEKADIANMANTLILLNRNKEALRLLETSYEKDKRNGDIAESLGFQYIKLNDLKKARKVFEENLKENPGSINSMRGIASIYISEKKLLEASHIYEKILKDKPDPDDYITFGQIESQRGNKKLALKSYQSAYRMSPNDSKTILALGYALAGNGDKIKAMTMFRKAFTIKPDIDSYIGLAFGLMTNGNYTQATEALDRAISINPDSAQAHYYRGLLWLDLGEKEMALIELERLSHLDEELAILFREEINSR